MLEEFASSPFNWIFIAAEEHLKELG